MAGVVVKGATFSFTAATGAGIPSAYVTSISVQPPKAEVTNLTGMLDPKGSTVIAQTGDCSSPGSITVDFIAGPGADVQTLVASRGQLTFSSQSFTISRNVVLEDASIQARTGELVSGTLRFTMTDYYGS